MLVAIRRPLPYREEVDPEAAYRAATDAGWDESTSAAWAAWTVHLPTANGEKGPIPWTIREVRHLRFLRAEYAAGAFHDGAPFVVRRIA